MNPTTNSLLTALEVLRERERQHELWGEQNHADGTGGAVYEAYAKEAREACDFHADNGTLTWDKILLEEVLEAFAETDPVTLREELIQVAAVAVSWIEAIDRRTDVPKD